MKALRDIVLTAEQVAAAPDEVQRWLRSLFGGDERLNSGFILEHNGFASSGDGLAICDSAVTELINSLTPYGVSLHAIRNVSGSPPTTIAVGIGSLRAWYLSRWMRPCLPSVI